MTSHQSTARAAFDRGYELIIVEDDMFSNSGPAHEYAVLNISSRMGSVRNTEQLLEALAY
jgi:nicotinamidase-related amidase